MRHLVLVQRTPSGSLKLASRSTPVSMSNGAAKRTPLPSRSPMTRSVPFTPSPNEKATALDGGRGALARGMEADRQTARLNLVSVWSVAVRCAAPVMPAGGITIRSADATSPDRDQRSAPACRTQAHSPALQGRVRTLDPRRPARQPRRRGIGQSAAGFRDCQRLTSGCSARRSGL